MTEYLHWTVMYYNQLIKGTVSSQLGSMNLQRKVHTMYDDSYNVFIH